MSNFVLKVSSGTLKNQAGAIKNEISRIQKQWNSIETHITRSTGYWEGEASNLHMSYYKSMKDQVNDILKRLGEHPDDLMKMAGIYEAAEADAAASANTLPDDVII